jgi:phage shock protein E
MKWTPILIIAAVVVVILLLKRTGQISAGDAQEHMKKGALVIDVRSSGEFRSGHLPSAINIPLGELESALPLRVRDKNQVLLLHCQSGMRSGIAAKKLKGMGYPNVFNLGSLSRASGIVGAAGGE